MMKTRAHRYLPFCIVSFALLLLVLPSPAAAAGACHSTTHCAPEFAACASWSTYSDCEDPFCNFAPYCSVEGVGIKQRRERFRVCFNESAQPCTEWQLTAFAVSCGC